MVASEQSISIGDDGTGPHPLVSCIMPTQNRRRFITQAIWYFLRQDYPARELVIVDDGDDQVEDLVPKDERIRYVRLPHRIALGTKRNRACELSRGSLIAHWDDDDWQAPHRLRTQVDALLVSGAEVTGASELTHYALMRGEAWRYRPLPSERPWVAGGTLLYRRSFWAAHPFREMDVGEDNAFVWEIPEGALHAVPDSSFYVALIHGGNTAPKHFDDPHWQRRPMAEVATMLLPDSAFYVELRNGRLANHRQISVPTSLTLGAHFLIYDGYGSLSEYLALGMARAGARVDIVPLGFDPAGYSDEFLALLRQSRPQPGAPTLYSGWMRAEMERLGPSDDVVVNTMWESSRLPGGWPEWLNGVRLVVVPTDFVARVCRESGVTVPIEVIPDGVDPAVYHYQQRPARDTFTVLMVGPVVDRKHIREGIEAWKRAFDQDPKARLIIKARFGYSNYVPDDPRIQFIDSNEASRGIAHWYWTADALMALGNEGFGLPLVEGLATGLPVVALETEGQHDMCRHAGAYLLRVGPASWQAVQEGAFGACGVRAVPDVGQVAAQLRWIADHRAEAAAMAEAGAEWVVRNRNVWSKGPRVLDAMESVLKPARPLRKTRTLWVPSWQSECGVAEYAAYLVAALPGSIRVVQQTPEAGSLRLLHVQHEDNLFHEAELVRSVHQARDARVPVVVTEHSVGQSPRAWEQEADVLIAMTRHGAARLRARWPNHRTEYLPHGCPTWFPPRKKQRGRVIGAFGFLAPQKGFWRLLDFLRSDPTASLLILSYARSPELEASWEQAARDLPVRRIRDFVPIEQVARQLAAETDVVTFWYDDITQASASGAVRIALASGVPVLASPTSWFADLKGVTYQPADLNEGIHQLLTDDVLRTALTHAARDYCHENSWSRTAERHIELWRELEAA